MSDFIEVENERLTGFGADSRKAVLIDFWAPWCKPCQTAEPMIDFVADEFDHRIKVVKINVDENPGLARQFNVSQIPAYSIVKQGLVVAKKNGVASLKEMKEFIEVATV